MDDLKMAQPAVTVCSQHGVESQACTPVVSQAPTPIGSPSGHNYAPLPPNLPQSQETSSKQDHRHLEHVSRPEVVRKFANPAPLGLCAFALTSFVSNCMNLYMANGTITGINIGLALTYGGISQFLAGMWYVVCCLSRVRYLACVGARNNINQGNGTWKHLWCDDVLFFWCLLDYFRHPLRN